MYVKITMCLLLFCAVRIEAVCPEFKSADNLNMTAFASGIWHNIARYKNHYETAEGCISLIFSLNNGVFRIDSIDAAEDHHHFVDASGKVEPDGKISLTVATGMPRQVADISLTVMFIDSEKYAVVYDCIHENNENKESFWIISRTKFLSDEDMETVMNYVKSTNIIDINRLLWLDNSDERCKQ